MKLFGTWTLITVISILSMLFGFSTVFGLEAANATGIYIEVNDEVYQGDSFRLRICLDYVNDLQAFQVHIRYNTQKVEVQIAGNGDRAVYSGIVGGTEVPVDMYYVGTGKREGILSLLGSIKGETGASGPGYIAEVWFKAIGEAESDVVLEVPQETIYKSRLFDSMGNVISTVSPWSSGYIRIVQPLPLEITTTALTKGAAGRPYREQLEATGGYAPYTWSSGFMPPGLAISASGLVSGICPAPGDYSLDLIVHDNYSSPSVTSKSITLTVCQLGDANQDGKVSESDVYKLVKIFLGIDPPNLAADVNGDGLINIQDAVLIKKLYQENR